MDVLVGLNDEGQTILTVTHERDFADYARRQVHLDGGIVERNFVNEYPVGRTSRRGPRSRADPRKDRQRSRWLGTLIFKRAPLSG